MLGRMQCTTSTERRTGKVPAAVNTTQLYTPGHVASTQHVPSSIHLLRGSSLYVALYIYRSSVCSQIQTSVVGRSRVCTQLYTSTVGVGYVTSSIPLLLEEFDMLSFKFRAIERSSYTKV